MQFRTDRDPWPANWGGTCRSMIVTTVTGATNKPGFGRPWLRAAEIVIMMHPAYRCTPLLVTARACMVAYDVYEAVPVRALFLAAR